ncbi:unnamed protein product [Ixodes persulcatus]
MPVHQLGRCKEQSTCLRVRFLISRSGEPRRRYSVLPKGPVPHLHLCPRSRVSLERRLCSIYEIKHIYYLREMVIYDIAERFSSKEERNDVRRKRRECTEMQSVLGLPDR